jgi:hypothetical protein
MIPEVCYALYAQLNVDEMQQTEIVFTESILILYCKYLYLHQNGTVFYYLSFLAYLIYQCSCLVSIKKVKNNKRIICFESHRNNKLLLSLMHGN